MRRKRVFTICIIAVLIAMVCLQGCGKAADEQSLQNQSENTGSTNDNISNDTGVIETDDKDNDGNNADNKVGDEPITDKPDNKNKDDNVIDDTNDTNSTKDSENITATNESAESKPDDAAKSIGPTYPSTAGALHVEETQLTDSHGNAIQLKGISTHGLAWFPEYVNEDCFRQFKQEWNVNVIRLAMYTAEYGGYCSGGDKEALKKLVKSGVEYATALDMYVIIDWHILSDNNPNTYINEAKEFFKDMAKTYAGNNNVLYEICNEPNGGTSWNDIKSYAEQVIPVIRSYDKDAVIIVGTPNWSQEVDKAVDNPITDYDNIMYALHFYAATHTDSLRNTMTAAIDAGLPVFVSEYGICDASGSGAIDENQANQWINTMDAYGVSYVAWNLSNKGETSAIINSGCSKVSGFTENDLSASGKWLHDMLTDGKKSNGAVNKDNESASAATPEGISQEATVTLSDGEITYTAGIKNSWESNGKFFYQYDVTLQNTSDADRSEWEIDILFSDTFSLSDGWNGDYTISDKTLHITSKDYNGSMAAGDSVNDVGFIISGSKNLKIEK
ncbi:MAG: cellulase family glycosylhydrolase [Lachnospiraceae bacterium]|nr:cellulase family glycosylhydrolase [Lachnospiraceae bacterium]